MFNFTPEKKKNRIKQVLYLETEEVSPSQLFSSEISQLLPARPSLVQFAPQGEGGLVLGLLEVNLMVGPAWEKWVTSVIRPGKHRKTYGK